MLFCVIHAAHLPPCASYTSCGTHRTGGDTSARSAASLSGQTVHSDCLYGSASLTCR